MKGVGNTDRRSFIKKIIQFALAHKVLSIGIPGTALGTGLIEHETRDLTLRKLDIAVAEWPKILNGYKIAHLSDLHLETLQITPDSIAHLSNSLDPDLLVITGDIISSRGDINRVDKYLSPLKAKDGKFVVMGNNDYSHFSRTLFQRYIRRLESLGFQVLLNSAKQVTSRNSRFWVIGVDDPATAHDDVELAFAKVPDDGLPRIVLAHSTDCIDDLYSRRVDLLLAGHTHGGQVRLPIIGAPIKNTLLATEGIDRDYHLIGGINVYISRGIGTSIMPLRIGVKPEVVGITLKAKFL